MSNDAGLFLIGLGVGVMFPALPAPLGSIAPHLLGLIVILIGVILMLKGSGGK